MLMRLFILLMFCFACQLSICAQKGTRQINKAVTIFLLQQPNLRVSFGVERLSVALKDAGYQVKQNAGGSASATGGHVIIVGQRNDRLVEDAVANFKIDTTIATGKEGFLLSSKKNATL